MEMGGRSRQSIESDFGLPIITRAGHFPRPETFTFTFRCLECRFISSSEQTKRVRIVFASLHASNDSAPGYSRTLRPFNMGLFSKVLDYMTLK